VEAVFINVGADGRDLSDLVSQRIGIVPLPCGATASALCRLDLEGLSKLFGWDQRSGVSLVTGLSTALAPRRRGRRSPLELDGRRIGGGGLGRIGGVEVEPRLQLGDRLLQLGDPSLQRAEDLQKRGLSLGRDGVPERFRDWWVRGHTVDSIQLLYKVFDPVNGYRWGFLPA
jgi:hypothetical protein